MSSASQSDGSGADSLTLDGALRAWRVVLVYVFVNDRVVIGLL